MSGSPLLHGASGEAQVRSALPPLGDGDLEGAADCRRAFSETSSLTVGFEEELILLDPITLLPINDVERAAHPPGGRSIHL